MAARPSSSTEISSESPTIGETTERLLLALAKKHLKQSQELSLKDPPLGLQFNHGQGRYLVTKLEMAVRSATDSMELSSRKQVSYSKEDNWKFIGKWKFLIRLAMDVESFVQECCKTEYWIQAASMLANAFEHVASLSSRLELCIWSFKNCHRIILGRALRWELSTISLSLDDQVKSMKEVEFGLNLESLSNLEGLELVTRLRGRLESVLDDNPVPYNGNLTKLSVRDQVNLLMKVEAALSSESISNLEEYELATSLAERFIASVSDPVSGKPVNDFMRVDFKSLRQAQEKELLGKGSVGEVYKVKWLGIPAAAKMLPGEDDGYLKVFNDEVSILARQCHPYIVRLLCYVKEDSNCSIVQELMDKDLTKLIEQRLDLYKGKAPQVPQKFPFSIEKVVDIMFQIAEGMDYLHRRRVLHRDLKSENILVKCKKVEGVDVEFVDAKVADFGTSKTKKNTITRSHPTWNIGTTRWMPPEVIRSGCKTGDWYPEWNLFQSDVYSFGMVSYEILVGHAPFVNDEPNAVKQNVLRGERPPLPSSYPSCLRSMIQKCWREEFMERPTFADICRELRFMKGALLIGWEL